MSDNHVPYIWERPDFPGWEKIKDDIDRLESATKPLGSRFPPIYSGNREPNNESCLPERWKTIPCSELEKMPDETRWIWEGCLGRGLATLYNALFKVGKTTLLAHLLRALEVDGEFCGRPVAASKILYVTEENQDNWAERRDELGLKDHIHFIVNPFLMKPDKRTWLAYLAYIVGQVKHHGYDLVVFDTISNLWPVRDENSSCEVQEALMPLRGLPKTASLLLVHHIGKADGDEGKAGRGSTALGGWVDIILEFRRYNPKEKMDTRRVLTGYGRPKCVPQELVLCLDGKEYRVEGQKKAVQEKELVDELDEIMPTEPPGLTAAELLEKIKSRKQSLQAVLKTGVEVGRWVKTGVRPARYYRPEPIV